MNKPIEIPPPKCEHCSEEIEPGPALFSWEHGAWVIFCVYCPRCRKTLHMSILPAVAAAAAVAASQEAQSPLLRN